MYRNAQLYGRRIETGRPGGVSVRLQEMLLQEILRGRWKIGERLPSYRDLAEETGLSQWTVNRALSMLEQKGYVECIRQKGVFVKAAAAPDGERVGRVVLVVPEEDTTLQYLEPGRMPVETQGFGRVDVHSLVESAEKLGLCAEVLRVPVDTGGDTERWAKATAATGLDLFGILSLAPAQRLQQLCGGELPPHVLYLGSDDPYSTPSLTGSPFQAALHVTEALLRQGHERIAVISDQHLHAGCEQAAFDGVAQAMRNAGIPASADGLPVIRHPQAAPPAGVTAVFAFSIDMARACAEAAARRGLSVPSDLAIVSLYSGWTLGERPIPLPGAQYHWDKIVASCFDILLSPESYAEQSLATLVYMPEVWREADIAPPPNRSGQPASPGAVTPA